MLTIYRTLHGAAAGGGGGLEAGRADAVAFASGSAVSSLLAAVPQVDLAATLLAACIGPVTAEVARRAGWQHILEAAQPTADGLAAVLARHLGPAR